MQIPAQTVELTIPAQTVNTNYQVVSHTLSLDSNGYTNSTFTAPTGTVIVGSGFTGVPDTVNGHGIYRNFPSSDGTQWTIEGTFGWLSLATPTLYLTSFPF